jgi:hypothetical protein
MSFVEKILVSFFRPVLAKNKNFLNLHKNETCYIIGNGGSLKNMDLESFSDHVTIGINHLCLHNDFHKLNVKYYVLVESFFLYPFCKNPYTKKYQSNILGKLFKKSFPKDSEINLFVSLTNLFGSKFRKIHYLFHFGYRNPDKKFQDPSGKFSFMSGGLHAAIGLAISLGFKKAILVGCDYTFSPVSNGHFYAFGPPKRIKRDYNNYEELFEVSKEFIDLSVITDFGKSDSLPFQTYEEFTGKSLKYHENNELIKEEYLEMLRKAVSLEQYGSKI